MDGDGRANQNVVPELDLCSGGIYNLIVGSRPPIRHALAMSFALWLPLFVLTLFPIQEWRLGSFLDDWPIHIRFSLSIPALMIAEWPIYERTRRAVKWLSVSDLISPSEKDQLARTVASVNRWERNIWPELITLSIFLVLSIYYVPRSSQYAWHEQSPLAFAWLRYVALPIYQTIVVRWLFRLGLWWRILYRISKFNLTVRPFHPDGVGGLAFLKRPQRPFSIIAFALGATLAANLLQSYSTQDLSKEALLKMGITFYIGSVILFLGPLLIFTPKLMMAKFQRSLGLLRFSSLCTRQFDDKWVLSGSESFHDQLVIETGDISSMNDLITSQKHADAMSVLLVDKKLLMVFAVATLSPLAVFYYSKEGWDLLMGVAMRVIA